MKKNHSTQRKRRAPKAILRLPDMDHAKGAVLNSLTFADAQRGYRHAIDEFIDWYCSELCLAFHRTVVLQYRIHLEFRRLAPRIINLRLGAVRRLAYEAADCGLLSPGLAAGIRRVEGVKGLEAAPATGSQRNSLRRHESVRGPRRRRLLRAWPPSPLRDVFHDALSFDSG
jgi:hypothetical protein